jgi:dTDP-4-amino-4,6-dideoxygalactose transaminase
VTPAEAVNGRHVYHIYAVRTPERDDMLRLLAEKNIGCAIHYPVAIHLQEAYQGLGYSEAISRSQNGLVRKCFPCLCILN